MPLLLPSHCVHHFPALSSYFLLLDRIPLPHTSPFLPALSLHLAPSASIRTLTPYFLLSSQCHSLTLVPLFSSLSFPSSSSSPSCTSPTHPHPHSSSPSRQLGPLLVVLSKGKLSPVSSHCRCLFILPCRAETNQPSAYLCLIRPPSRRRCLLTCSRTSCLSRPVLPSHPAYLLHTLPALPSRPTLSSSTFLSCSHLSDPWSCPQSVAAGAIISRSSRFNGDQLFPTSETNPALCKQLRSLKLILTPRPKIDWGL